MQKRIIMILSISMLVLSFISWKMISSDNQMEQNKEQVARGEYLVTIAGCDDCHSSKVMTDMGPQTDTSRRLSGHPQDATLPDIDMSMIGKNKWGIMGTNDMTAFVGPWGVSFAINLTPDEETGIGLWTEDVFVEALKTGKHLGKGRPILPPMPWYNLAKAKDEDLEAIFAYLKTLKPIKNKVPVPIPPSDILTK